MQPIPNSATPPISLTELALHSLRKLVAASAATNITFREIYLAPELVAALHPEHIKDLYIVHAEYAQKDLYTYDDLLDTRNIILRGDAFSGFVGELERIPIPRRDSFVRELIYASIRGGTLYDAVIALQNQDPSAPDENLLRASKNAVNMFFERSLNMHPDIVTRESFLSTRPDMGARLASLGLFCGEIEEEINAPEAESGTTLPDLLAEMLKSEAWNLENEFLLGMFEDYIRSTSLSTFFLMSFSTKNPHQARKPFLFWGRRLLLQVFT